MDIDLTILILNGILPEFEQQTTFEKRQKIELLYSYGFIYMPYDKEFVNPIIKKSFKLQIANSSYEQIIQFLNNNTPSRLTEETLENKIDEAYTHIDKGRSSRVLLGLWSMPLSMLAFIVGVSLHFFNESLQLTCLILLSISCCLIHYWVASHFLLAKFENVYLSAPLYYNYKRLWQIARAAIFMVTLYVCYGSINISNFWIVVVGILFLLLTNLLIMKHLKDQWWGQTGLSTLKEYYYTPS
jgi:hypothetical protein